MEDQDREGSESLLTIKEAAAFLNVSVMSLRRWTNAGKLRCYRVGRKNERRFRKEDLEAFLQGHRSSLPLGVGSFELEEPAHISHFYRTEKESLETGLGYVKQGLDRGELVLVMSPEPRRQLLLNQLERQGVLVPVLLERGILTACGGMDTPAAQAKLIDEVLARAKGWNGFRLLGDMTWTQDYGWNLEMLTTLEQFTNQHRAGRDALFLCQYDVELFSRDTSFMAMQTHDFTLYHGKLNASPYYGMKA